MLSKLRKSEAQYSKLRDLLRGVREELAAREKGGVVPKEDFERLWLKYDRAKAKVRSLEVLSMLRLRVVLLFVFAVVPMTMSKITVWCVG